MEGDCNAYALIAVNAPIMRIVYHAKKLKMANCKMSILWKIDQAESMNLIMLAKLSYLIVINLMYIIMS